MSILFQLKLAACLLALITGVALLIREAARAEREKRELRQRLRDHAANRALRSPLKPR